MKTSMCIAFASVMISTSACAQKKEDTPKLPAAVEKAFVQKFPEASKAIWEKENEQEWEAEFKLDGVEYSAKFLADGTWKETEQEIKVAQLPVPVQDAMKAQFADYKIKEAELAETSDGTVFELEIQNGKEKLEVVFSPSGELLKKEVEKEDHEEKED